MPGFEKDLGAVKHYDGGQYISDPGAIPTVTSGALDPSLPFHLISVTGTQAYTLANGTYRGQRVAFNVIVAASTPDGTLTPAAFGDGTSIDLDAVNEAGELIWTGSTWRLVYLIGGAVNS